MRDEAVAEPSATAVARLSTVRREIAAACADAGRHAGSVPLVAVSKTFARDAIAPVIAAGQLIVSPSFWPHVVETGLAFLQGYAIAVGAGLAPRVLYHAAYLNAVFRGLHRPVRDALPAGRGVWEEVFAALHDADTAETERVRNHATAGAEAVPAGSPATTLYALVGPGYMEKTGAPALPPLPSGV